MGVQSVLCIQREKISLTEYSILLEEEKGNEYVISIPTNERIHTTEKNKSKELLKVLIKN